MDPLDPLAVYPSSPLISMRPQKEGQHAEVHWLEFQMVQPPAHNAESSSPWPHILITKEAQSHLRLSLFHSPSHLQTLVCPILFLGIPACPTK